MEKSLEAQNPRKVGTQPMENSQEYYPYRVHTQCWNPPYWGEMTQALDGPILQMLLFSHNLEFSLANQLYRHWYAL